MKPAPFAYHAPVSLEQAVQLLSTLKGDVMVTAGGQSLLPMMNLRIARPDHLVDLRLVDSLSSMTLTDTHLQIGATTTHRMIETSPVVRRAVPLLGEMASNIGHIPIRERGTIGGSVSLADPTAEFPLAAIMLDAELTLSSVRGTRTLNANDFFLSALQTALAEDEILTSLSFPLMDRRSGSAFIEFSRRKGDFCIVGVVAVVRVMGGHFEAARIGLCGVSERPFLSKAADGLVGRPTGEAAIDGIATEIAAEIEPMSDGRAEFADRRDITRTLVKRTVLRAVERAAGAAQGSDQ